MAGEDRAAVVLALVRGLVAEVHPHASRLSVTLDSPFGDLGIGSLELVELFVAGAGGVRGGAAPHVLASADTPGDLLRGAATPLVGYLCSTASTGVR